VDVEGNFYSSRAPYSSRYLVVRKGYAHPEAIIKTLNIQIDMHRYQHGFIPKCPVENPWCTVDIFPWNMDYPDGVERRVTRLKAALAGQKPADFSAEEEDDLAACQREQQNPKQNLADWGRCHFRLEGADMMNQEIMSIYPVQQAARIIPGEETWPNLTKLEDQVLLSIIVGEKPVDYFDTFVADWLAQGGEEVLAKMQAAYDGSQ
jgi:putative aldouronate transport system substrate-binding protein